MSVGPELGTDVGPSEGTAVGLKLGADDGPEVGTAVGLWLGTNVVVVDVVDVVGVMLAVGADVGAYVTVVGA